MSDKPREWWVFGRYNDQCTQDPTDRERELGIRVIEYSAYEALRDDVDRLRDRLSKQLESTCEWKDQAQEYLDKANSLRLLAESYSNLLRESLHIIRTANASKDWLKEAAQFENEARAEMEKKDAENT